MRWYHVDLVPEQPRSLLSAEKYFVGLREILLDIWLRVPNRIEAVNSDSAENILVSFPGLCFAPLSLAGAEVEFHQRLIRQQAQPISIDATFNSRFQVNAPRFFPRIIRWRGDEPFARLYCCCYFLAVSGG